MEVLDCSVLMVFWIVDQLSHDVAQGGVFLFILSTVSNLFKQALLLYVCNMTKAV